MPFPRFLLSSKRFSKPFWVFLQPLPLLSPPTSMQRKRSQFFASKECRFSRCVPCFVCIDSASNLDQLLSVDICCLRQDIVPSFLEGCCIVSTQLSDVQKSWLIAQLQKARCLPDLTGLKVLLSSAQPFVSSSTIELVNECKEVANYLCLLLGTVEKDEYISVLILIFSHSLDVWKDCVSSLIHILAQIDPPSLVLLSEMLLERIQNSGNALFMTLFGDLLLTSASFNLYIHRTFLS